MEEFDAILRIVDAGGTIALLLLALYAIYSGRVVPASLLQTVIERVVSEVLDELDRRGKI